MKYAIENGIVDLSYVQEKYEMNKREEILKEHPYKIWEGKDGKWYTYLPDEKKGRRLIKKSTKESVESEVVKYRKAESENPTIEDIFTRWNDRRLSLSKISNATHLRNAQVFRRHYGEFGGRKIKTVDPEEIIDFLEEQIALHDLSAKAFSNLKTITRGFLKYAKRNGLVHFNVEELFQELDVSEVDFRKTVHEDYEEVFDEAETETMVAYLKENLDTENLAILLMFATGARIGEIVALKHSDFEDDCIRIRRTETRYVKNSEYVYEVKEFPKSAAGVRTVVLPESFSWIPRKVRTVNPFSEYVFVRDGRRLTTQSVRMRLKRVCRKLGIYHKSPHKIRKTYCTILLDSGVDKRLIIEQVGHTDISCTENHYHRNRRDVDAKKEILSAVPDFAVK